MKGFIIFIKENRQTKEAITRLSYYDKFNLKFEDLEFPYKFNDYLNLIKDFKKYSKFLIKKDIYFKIKRQDVMNSQLLVSVDVDNLNKKIEIILNQYIFDKLPIMGVILNEINNEYVVKNTHKNILRALNSIYKLVKQAVEGKLWIKK